MDLLLLLQLAWLFAVLIGLLSFSSHFCRCFVLHGKTRTSAAIPQFLRIEVPKSYYTWFYLIGALHSNLILALVIIWKDTRMVQKALHLAHPLAGLVGNGAIPIQPHSILFLTLFSVHTTRRFLESLLVTEFGDSMMHASIMFVGIFHYVATVLSVVIDPGFIQLYEFTASRWAMSVVGIVIYFIAFYHQSRCNYLLAKQKRASTMKYVIPKGDWFRAVRSPLYTTETMLYIAFVLVTGGTIKILYFVLTWVVVNQVLLAHINSQWVENKFREKIHEFPKWKLLPYVW
ncbi:uncharacterized protein CCR75_005632 [Bremia lactucae]|uniref:3-oxo-5-alpha-steroid 4-dehydrogenase C-terminal domain-containing protein n=1 Tax=Bremia lactucae TaxID=4779 RepID=A0A976FH04_BRELC|nr:hypothetical protein CCR75_005632 [Bremia lactucae]